MVLDLFKVVNENEGCVVSLDITSIVKGEPISSYISYPHIKNALFTGIQGHYEMAEGYPGYSHYEGLSDNGLLINFMNSQQLFISENSKIKNYETEGNITFDIKDKYSSMNIKLQVFTKTKVSN